jgi:hypothetical protein
MPGWSFPSHYSVSLSLDTNDQRPTFDRIEERMRTTYFHLPTMSRCERFFIE